MSKARKKTATGTIDTPIHAAPIVELGDNFTVAFETIRADVDTAPAFKGLPRDRCPCPHWGLAVCGRITMRYEDHDETWEGGDIFYTPAGHLPFCPAGTELITFSPTEQLKKVNAYIARNVANTMAQA